MAAALNYDAWYHISTSNNTTPQDLLITKFQFQILFAYKLSNTSTSPRPEIHTSPAKLIAPREAETRGAGRGTRRTNENSCPALRRYPAKNAFPGIIFLRARGLAPPRREHTHRARSVTSKSFNLIVQI